MSKTWSEEELCSLLSHAEQSEVMHAVRFILQRASDGARSDVFHTMTMEPCERAYVCGRGAMAESILSELAQYCDSGRTEL